MSQSFKIAQRWPAVKWGQVLAIAATGWIAVSAVAQEEMSADDNGPKRGAVANVGSPIHDFGEVWTNKTLEHAFTLTNIGDEVLKIMQVKPSCGCTVAGTYPKEIKPGESGKFPFRLNSAKLRGRFSKTISVKTNDDKAGLMRWTLTGSVKHFVEVTPSMAQFGQVDAETTRTKTINIKNNTQKIMKLTLSDNNAKSETFDAELVEVAPGKEYNLNITAHPPFTPKLNRHLFKVETNLDEQKAIDIICMANYPPRMEFQPDSIVIQPVARDVVRKVRLRNNGDKPVNLKSAEVDDTRIIVESRPIQEGKQYELSITIPANYEPGGNGNATVVVKTDDPEYAEMRLPVRAVRPRAERGKKRPAEMLVGSKAPVHGFKTVDNESMTLGGESDKVKVVTFYASWCGFCKRALPQLQSFYDRNKDKDMEMVLINVDDRGEGRRARTEEQSLNHYKDMKLSIPLHMDNNKSITPSYKVVSYPTTFVIGKSGVIEDVVMGAKPDIDRQLAKDVDMLLAGRSLTSVGGGTKRLIPNPAAQRGGTLTTGATVVPRKPKVLGEIPVVDPEAKKPAKAPGSDS